MNNQDVLTIALIVISIKLIVGLSLWFIIKPTDSNSTLPRDVARRWLAYSFLIGTLSGENNASLLPLITKTLVGMLFFGAIAYAFGYVYALLRQKRLTFTGVQATEISFDHPRSISKNLVSSLIVIVLLAFGVMMNLFAVFSKDSDQARLSLNEVQEPSITLDEQNPVVDQLFLLVQTYPSPLQTNSVVNLVVGLPAEQKNEVAPFVKPWIADVVKEYQASHVANGGSLNDLRIRISSAQAALGGDQVDSLFIEFEALGWCGSGGCHSIIAINTENGWVKAGDLFGCAKIKLLKSKSNGYRDFSYSQCRSGNTYLYRFNGQRYEIW